MVLSYAKHGKKIHIYAFKLCAAISDDFRKSPEMAVHDLDTYIFIFTKIGMFSPHFSAMRPAFLKLFFQWGSFDIGLIRVGASPEFTTVTSTMSRLNYRTHIKHCETFIFSTIHSGQKVLLVNHDCKESLVIKWSTQTLFNIY